MVVTLETRLKVDSIISGIVKLSSSIPTKTYPSLIHPSSYQSRILRTIVAKIMYYDISELEHEVSRCREKLQI